MNTIKIARELQALAQTGLHFSTDPYDRERYERLRVIAAEMLSAQSDVTPDDLLNWSRAEFGYATPKVDVRAFILQRGKLLLIREDADQGAGRFQEVGRTSMRVHRSQWLARFSKNLDTRSSRYRCLQYLTVSDKGTIRHFHITFTNCSFTAGLLAELHGRHRSPQSQGSLIARIFRSCP